MQQVDYAALTERTCSACKVTKPVAEFGKFTDSSAPLTGWRYSSRCFDCARQESREYGQKGKARRNERLRQWRAANPEKARLLDRRKRLRKNYGLTIEQADAILAHNDGRCWICDDAEAVAIDHDHKTGEVRGGLCFSCNTFLGRIECNPKILVGLAAYMAGEHADVLLELVNR